MAHNTTFMNPTGGDSLFCQIRVFRRIFIIFSTFMNVEIDAGDEVNHIKDTRD